MKSVKIISSTIPFNIFLIICLVLAYFARYLLLTSLIGIGLGTLIAPILKKLRLKFKFRKSLSAIIVLLGIVIISAGVLASIYFLAADQFNSLAERSPQILQSIENWFTQIFNQYPWLKDKVQEFDVARSAQQSVINVLQGFKVGVMAVSGAVFALLIGLYTAVNSEEYFDSAIEAFPPKHRSKAKNIMLECGETLKGWFRAQLIDMLIIGIVTAIGLWICGVQYWAIFGLLTAIMGIIPYVGILIVVSAASLITLASDPGQIIWVLVVFGITQQLEGNVILPLVMKDRVQIPEVPLLIFMLLLGSYLGILGVFIAPPLFAMIRILYLRIYLPYIEGTVRTEIKGVINKLGEVAK